MRILFIICLGVLCIKSAFSQSAELYFPPNSGNVWQTLSPDSLNWCPDRLDSLSTLLETNGSKAFILLKDGKIVLEWYFNGHSASSTWYWASAGKTLTATLVGIAQQEGHLSTSDPVDTYLGQGWTSCDPVQEEEITIWNQLTMTTGLDDGVADVDCTEPECLLCLDAPGDRWAYHNAPYTLLDPVLEAATGIGLNIFAFQRILQPTGMDGLYIPIGFNSVFFSTARSMARFGLLTLAGGNWNGNAVLNDEVYYEAMVTPSQTLNPAYGYLWWLNGQDSYMVPGLQFSFGGSLCPAAPADMFCALGRDGQFINVVPSENLVWIRMGEAPDESLVPFLFNNAIWESINQLECAPVSVADPFNETDQLKIYPNPANRAIRVKGSEFPQGSVVYIYNSMGQQVGSFSAGDVFDISGLEAGRYFAQVEVVDGGIKYLQFIIGE